MSRELVWFDEVRRNGRVCRWHTEPKLGDQTVADHSWGVLMLAGWLTDWKQPLLLKLAATHDLGEYATGDTPAHVKRTSQDAANALEQLENQELSRLELLMPISVEGKAILKLADYLEAMHFCLEAVRRGEWSAMRPFNRMADWIRDPGFPDAGKEALLKASLLLRQMQQEIKNLL